MGDAVTYGGRPGQDGQQGWTGGTGGWAPPQVPPQWRYGHAQRPAWYGMQAGPQAPSRPGPQEHDKRGQQEHDKRGQQPGADPRWQHPAFRYGQERYRQDNAGQGHPPGRSQPHLPPARPAQPEQQGFGPSSPKPPSRAPQPPYQPPRRPPQRGTSWPARHKALAGILALVALIVIIGAVHAGLPSSGPGSGTTAGLRTTTSPTLGKTPSHHATHAAAAAPQTPLEQTQPADPATSYAPAPSAPAPTTHAAVVVVAPRTSTAPASAAPATTAPSSATSATCQPLTNGGNCYEPGDYCRAADHGVTGVAGDGETITCENNDGWHWGPS